MSDIATHHWYDCSADVRSVQVAQHSSKGYHCDLLHPVGSQQLGCGCCWKLLRLLLYLFCCDNHTCRTALLFSSCSYCSGCSRHGWHAHSKRGTSSCDRCQIVPRHCTIGRTTGLQQWLQQRLQRVTRGELLLHDVRPLCCGCSSVYAALFIIALMIRNRPGQAVAASGWQVDITRPSHERCASPLSPATIKRHHFVLRYNGFL